MKINAFTIQQSAGGNNTDRRQICSTNDVGGLEGTKKPRRVNCAAPSRFVVDGLANAAAAKHIDDTEQDERADKGNG